ncbi:MAG: ABC transporter ATP-binding protein [Elusimicrobia bacterium]|nr:ABC transporter ATP-binding protein [Elusimicrobiota bacterium]
MDIVQFKALTKRYRIAGFFKSKEIVGIEDLSLTIAGGEIFGLLGLNGSGKTTSLRLLLGLIVPTKGEVLVLGKQALRHPEIRSELGYLPERCSFPATLTPLEMLEFFARLDAGKFSNGLIKSRRITDALNIVGLDRAAERKVGTFSKGMVQRLGIAQAILHEPRLLVLDEPASGLDPLGIIEMRELFRRLNNDLGITVLFSSHSISEVEAISDRVGVIAGNRLRRVFLKKEWSEPGAKRLEEHFVETVKDFAGDGSHWELDAETDHG